MIGNDVKLTSHLVSRRKIMDVDVDDEYMNAAAAHVAFVITVSAARMYLFLCHAQHARDINIHMLHPLPEKNRLRLCRFSAQ